MLEITHNAGFVHNGITGLNVACGQHAQCSDQVKRCILTEFGCATKYLDEQGNHVDENEKVRGIFEGNELLASYQAMSLKKTSRRCDLMSLGYLLLVLLRSFVLTPMVFLHDKYPRLVKAKKYILVSELCSTPASKVLVKYFEEVYSYKYHEQP